MASPEEMIVLELAFFDSSDPNVLFRFREPRRWAGKWLPSDTEGSDGVSGLGVNWGLTGQLLQHFGGSGEPITGLSHTNVEDELLNSRLEEH